MMRHIDPFAVEMFIAVVDTGGFTSAAASLGRTQSAISTRIADLEASLGHKLLKRGSRGIRVTEAGERLLGEGRRWLALERHLLDHVMVSKTGGPLRIGIPDDWMDPFIKPIIGRFVAQNPTVTIEVSCDLSQRLEQRISRKELDLAIITRDHANPVGELLRVEPLVWVAARDYRPEEHDPLPLALFSEPCRFRQPILDTLNASRRAHKVVYVSSHTTSVHSAIDSGFCVSAMIRSAVPRSMRCLGPDAAFPPLPSAEIALLQSSVRTAAAERFAAEVRSSLA